MDLSWILDMAIGFQQNEISEQLKQKFIVFFEKVENLKNVLITKKAEQCKGSHVCNFCGE